MTKNKTQLSELIRFTAIAFSNGETEQAITLSLKEDYDVNEADIVMVLLGSTILRQGLTDSLKALSKTKAEPEVAELPTN